jgi:hypothetical protein
VTDEHLPGLVVSCKVKSPTSREEREKWAPQGPPAPLFALVGTVEIANLFCVEKLTSVKRSIDFLKT